MMACHPCCGLDASFLENTINSQFPENLSKYLHLLLFMKFDMASKSAEGNSACDALQRLLEGVLARSCLLRSG